MKIAVTSQGEGMNARVDPRFGRARYFIVVDTETGESSTVDNAVNLTKKTATRAAVVADDAPARPGRRAAAVNIHFNSVASR